MFGRKAIGNLVSFVNVCGKNHNAIAIESFACDAILAAVLLRFGNHLPAPVPRAW